MPVNAGLSSRLKISIPTIILFVGSIFYFPYITKAFVGIVLLRSLWEFFNIFKSTLPAYSKVTLTFAFLYLCGAWDLIEPQQTPLCLIGLLALFSTQLFFPSAKGGIVRTAISMLGFVYVIGLGSYAFYIINLSLGDQGQLWGARLFLASIFTCKFSDATAYFAGNKFGRRKLIPRVSPNKTWEGLWGAYAGGIVSIPFFYTLEGFGFLSSLLICILLVTIASLGDLFESQFKRELNVKDTANDIPGFGGTMDMIDSILWVLPLTYWFVVLTGIHS
jgi:CDP-diglyceride synthetase